MPCRVSTDSEGRVLVADCGNHRIPLLNSELQLVRVLVDADSTQVELKWPEHFHYSELTSQLHVLHDSEPSRVISIFNLR